ncbi:S8 family serine peptidase [Streptomyces sodiiphilus]|uniref:S8 family serine peptidase n=1 Tax=Streptomyces sodiiphilus TaxID=226217 RepID=A0ABN2NUV8_9ACTN
MSLSPRPSSASPGMRRTARVTLAAGLVAAVAMAGATPALADDAPRTMVDKPLDEKFSTADATLLAEAQLRGDTHVTMMIAAEPGATEDVSAGLESVEGTSVGYAEDAVGYLRVTVPTGKAEAAIDRARAMSSVHAIDLNEEIPLPDPVPEARGAAGKAGSYPGPGPDTPAANPYQPSHEIGAVDFVRKNPKFDGRGVTIGVLDTGVDLAHPALQETTTGERKIVDSVTATDPIIDSDLTWRPMVTEVSGEVFTYNGREYKAPEGDYLISLFRESATAGGEMNGDLDRDGATTSSWAVLYDPEAGTVTLDLDDDGDFRNDTPMKPYKENFDVGYFGEDDPDTEIAESIPFVVEIRKDVPMDPYGGSWVGETADFVNIGIVSNRHGTHVAGITAAHGLFGGKMNGAAPGAQIVSSRACAWSGGCTYTALTEGMIDLVVNRGVDIVNMSIGGLPALNDGNNARARLYTELIDTYGVQLVISAGNSGPGANTVGDPSVADKVVSVGAAVSKETWAANYGSQVKKAYNMFPFSSRGPRADGGFKPTISGPGASINTIPTWQPGSSVPDAGYGLPPGYGMLQGTSMSSPQVAGASALLLSAAGQRGIDLTPADLRTALTSSAKTIRNVQAYEQGAGLMDTPAAWKLIAKRATAHEYTVSAPVSHDLSENLRTPHTGTGIYDRESAPAVGEKKAYEVTVTRTSGPKGSVSHKLRLVNNHGKTFRIAGRSVVKLPLGKPVTVTVEAAPRTAGIHSAILTIDDPRTKGTDAQMLATVISADELAAPDYTVANSGTAERNDPTSYFVKVPEGTKSLEIAMSGLAEGSQTRWVAINPWGIPADSTSAINCYPNFDNPANPCPPGLRSYQDPIPGVWEIEVEARRTSPMLKNPYTVTATALGTSFDPGTQVVEEAELGTPTTVTWEVSNDFAGIQGSFEGGDLGSAVVERPTIADGEWTSHEVELPANVSRFDLSLSSPADSAADLDLYVYHDGVLVGSSTRGDSEENVSLADPAPGVYTVEVHGYSVPAGTTEYDYRDSFISPDLGRISLDEDGTIDLPSGATASVDAEVLVTGAAPEGREFFGEVRLLNERGTPTGTGGIRIERVVTP